MEEILYQICNEEGDVVHEDVTYDELDAVLELLPEGEFTITNSKTDKKATIIVEPDIVTYNGQDYDVEDLSDLADRISDDLDDYE